MWYIWTGKKKSLIKKSIGLDTGKYSGMLPGMRTCMRPMT